MNEAHQLFVKMATRNSIVNAEQPTTPRRSSRLLHRKKIPEPEDPKTHKPKSRLNKVGSPDPSLSSTEDVSVKKNHKDYAAKVTKKSGYSDESCGNLSTGSRKSPRLNNGVERKSNDGSESCVNLSSGSTAVSRKSARLKNAVEKELRRSNDGPKICVNLSIGSRKSPRLTNGVEEKMSKSNDGSKDCVNLSTGLRKSPRLNNGVEGFRDLRQSSKVSNLRNAKEQVEKTTDSRPKRAIKFIQNKDIDKEVLSYIRNGKVGDDTGSEEIGVSRKRKRRKEGNGNSQGWTEEQELALQRAYFAAKPTPHFWKKISKLVPGKSAQDCFDKVHSDHITPPQQQPRSRANRIKTSSLDFALLSASKLVKPTEIKSKRPSCNKPKSHFAQKTVRDLLQKHYHVDQDYETDLFSVLETNMNESTQASQSSVILSTPTNLQKKQGFLQKCCERSSSGQKKPLSRFSTLSAMPLVSPPVLKQVKNRALHEKYIDQLHYREVKRKAASARAEKLIRGKENRSEIHFQKFEVVKTAKNALVSDARDAINQLQHLQANVMSNSSDFDVDGNDDEGEDEL